ncbi:MAG: sugar ABC transporter ATP-binding protein [Chloroflexi bacterium]|nr:sugar ABC transporter ATP-binding protein [Chloroflexota bacterium]
MRIDPDPRSTPAPPATPALVATGLGKRYGDTTVLDDVDLVVEAGEVHALLGENGAGKSTLIKIVSGVVTPDRGGIVVSGRTVPRGSPQAAIAAGVSTLFQELAPVPGLSVAENVLLGPLTPSRLGIVDRRRLHTTARALFAEVGRDIDVTQPAERLSPVEQTMTAIARALARECRLLILDEPTAALTDAETSELFRVMARLQARGVGILYVSHRLDEVARVATRYTVLRNGQRVADGTMAGTSVSSIITSMAGRPIETLFPPGGATPGPSVLVATGISGRRIRDVSIEVRAGEVLGIAGLAGSGRSELLRIIGGASRAHAGTWSIDGHAVRPSSPADAQAAGVALVPQERRSQALLPDTVERNLVATTIGRHVRLRGIVSRGRERGHARELWERFDIRGRGLEQEVLTLSGGNQQKVVLADFLALRPRLLLLDEPTRGVDVATRSEIYRLIRAQADAGCAVVMVSSELPEILGLGDRIVVLHEGRVTGRFARGEVDEDGLLHACYAQVAA